MDLQPQAAVLKAEDTWRLREEWWGFDDGGGGGGGGGGSVGTMEMSLERQNWKEGIRSSLNCFAIINSLSHSMVALSLLSSFYIMVTHR